MTLKRITAVEAKARLQEVLEGRGELAFLDLREAGQYGEGHPFFVVNLPYSRLERLAPDLLPRKETPLLLLDDGDGISERAARRFEALGYPNLAMIEGGAAAWEAAGYGLFKGVNLPSKAFGELVEAEMHTPSIPPERLAEWLSSDDPPLVLDGRSPQEFQKMAIPGGLSCPNAELPFRLEQLLDRPDRPVVVNCAGRTRSIIGAQGLINAGFENPIYALENGTQGWELAGLSLERGGQAARLPEPEGPQRERARRRAAAYRARFGVPTADWDRLTAWREDPDRSFYLFDVRTAEEFASGHLPGARHAPGGQLVQATDLWVAVRGARIVLCDDCGLRAAVTAAWLRGMGHDARPLDLDVTQAEELERQTPAAALPPEPGIPVIAPGEISQKGLAGVPLFDFSSSTAFRAGHPSGARWASRARLSKVPASAVVTADDPWNVSLAALDLAEEGRAAQAAVLGSRSEWEAAGYGTVATPQVPSDAESIDYLFFVHDRHDGNLEAARQYLAWETGLLDRMDESEKAVLRPPKPVA